MPIAIVAWLATTVTLLWTAGPGVAHDLGDPDDALRLQQVRDLLFGAQGWYDLVQHRFNPPEGVFIHWSRLVDLPVAGLILLFRPFVGIEAAEMWTRALWPTLSILPLVASAGMIAGRIGGLRTASVAIVFTCLACTFISVLRPGHLYHHNVQLAATMVLFACLTGQTRGAAFGGGLVAALMLAVGMQTMPYTALACAIVTLRWAVGGNGMVLRWFFGSFAVAATLAFGVTVAPSLWTAPSCDMISPVYLVPLAAGAAAFVVLAKPCEGGPRRRVALVAVVALVALGLVALLNPVCLKGPYGAVDPLLFAVWMDKVGEARSALAVFRENPAEALAVFAIPAAGLLGGAWLLVKDRTARQTVLRGQMALVALAFAVSLWQVRAVAFDTMFALPVLAALLARIATVPALARRSALALPALCIVVNPLTLPLYGVSAGSVIAANRIRASAALLDHCVRPEDYAALAALPPGRIAAPVEIGSFIIATTPHSVLAAPYHRDRTGILDVYAILTGPNAEARVIAARRGVDYVVYCSQSPEPAQWATGGATGLETRLEHGEGPSWLRRVVTPGSGPLRIYQATP